MASPTTHALIRVDGSLRWRREDCHNFTVNEIMTTKFNAETVYKDNEHDNFLRGDPTKKPWGFTTSYT